MEPWTCECVGEMGCAVRKGAVVRVVWRRVLVTVRKGDGGEGGAVTE